MKIVRWRDSRRGLLLFAVVIVIAMLSYSAYEFSHWISVESEMTTLVSHQVQARYLAESGVELVQALALLQALGRKVPEPANYSELFEGITVPLDVADEAASAASESSEAGRFSIFVAEPNTDRLASLQPGEATIRFGTEAEAARIHLNHWASADAERLRTVLSVLPGGTPELADAVLDWIDADEIKRENGAEREEYDRVDPPILPRNGPVESVEELLLVRGMTPDILYGEDLNRNGQLDPSEDDGATSPPFDNEDGKLDRGWLAFLTLTSQEPRVAPSGAALIDLNDPDLARLYGRVRELLGEAWARYIAACRVIGTPTSILRSDFPAPGQYSFASLLDLVDGEVRGKWEKEDVEIRSPVQSSSPTFKEELSRVLDQLQIGDGFARVGRVDLGTAPLETMKMVDDFPEEALEKLIESRPAPGLVRELEGMGSEPAVASGSGDLVVTLLTADGFPREMLRGSEERWTWKSPVIRFQSVGYFDTKRISHRVEVIIDRGSVPGLVKHWRRLDRWGAGISLEQLGRGTEVKPLPVLGDGGEAGLRGTP